MNLAVIGAGYVGLVTASVFAKFGHKVWLVDIDKRRIENLKKGKIPFYEPGLERLIKKNTAKLTFTTDYEKAIPQAEVIFICVGTPNKDGEVELKYVLSAARSIAQNLKKPTIVAIKSTVPPGTNEQVEKIMKKETEVKFGLASCPEFLREGKALEDTLNPDRVVIGANKRRVIDKLLKLHQPIGGERVICDPTSAQLIKYAANAFLPLKISFANAIAILTDCFGADITKVMEGVGADKRIGKSFLAAGLGFGGSCLPKDVAALIDLAQKKGYNFELLRAVKTINKTQVNYFVNKVIRLCGGSVKGKTTAVLGLAFKPETSDMREARSIEVIKGLKRRGAKVRACDPVAISEARKILFGVKFFADPYQALKGADALLLVTEWEEYKKLDFNKVKRLMRTPVVVDGRNIYNRKKLEKLGFIYEGIGR